MVGCRVEAFNELSEIILKVADAVGNSEVPEMLDWTAIVVGVIP